MNALPGLFVFLVLGVQASASACQSSTLLLRDSHTPPGIPKRKGTLTLKYFLYFLFSYDLGILYYLHLNNVISVETHGSFLVRTY